MPRARTPAIPAKMYRHFAIVTVALTTGVAMFADGENREASAAQAAVRAPAPRDRPAAFATPETATPPVPVGWDDATEGGFGEPTEPVEPMEPVEQIEPGFDPPESGGAAIVPEEGVGPGDFIAQ